MLSDRQRPSGQFVLFFTKFSVRRKSHQHNDLCKGNSPQRIEILWFVASEPGSAAGATTIFDKNSYFEGV
jgi:hypothetical protein